MRVLLAACRELDGGKETLPELLYLLYIKRNIF